MRQTIIHAFNDVTVQVRGVLLFDLTPEDMYVLDQFEGEEYYKTDARPMLLEQCEALGLAAGSCIDTSIYIWRHSLRHLLHGEWDPEGFETRYLDSYLDMCREFAREVREEQKATPNSRPFGFKG